MLIELQFCYSKSERFLIRANYPFLANISCEYFENYLMWIFITLDININDKPFNFCNKNFTFLLIQPIVDRNDVSFSKKVDLNYMLEFTLFSRSILGVR